MSTRADWEELGRSSRAFVNALEERWEARKQAKAEAAARFQPGSPAYADIDYAARLYAVRQALLAEIARLDPHNALLDPNVRKGIADRGLQEFVQRGRQDYDDADLIRPHLP